MLNILESKNDINLYVTFSECAPMVILESFAVNDIVPLFLL